MGRVAHPGRELGVLGDVSGLDVFEYGCGAAQWSIALAADGARVVGLDQSSGQLGHARTRMRAAGVAVALVSAAGEHVPFAAATFDVVFCDHGAMSFCDPARSVPEVARLLRPGGRLAFAHCTPLWYLTYDEQRDRQTRRLQRPYFGMRRLAFGDGTVDFQIPHGEWIRLFRAHGLVVDDLIELRRAEKGPVHVVRLGQALRPPVAHRADLEAPQGTGARGMSTHHYATTVSWEGSTGVGYDHYDRGHTAGSPRRTGNPPSGDPAFGGDAARA